MKIQLDIKQQRRSLHHMHLSALEKHTCRTVPLSPEIWARAMLLGEARTKANEDRKQTSDRGEYGNEEVDHVGALGELVLLTIVERENATAAAEKMVSNLFAPASGSRVIGPDLVVVDPDASTECGIDAKTFSCKPSYRNFAINAKKHADLRGACDWYFPVIVPRYGRKAFIGKLVPYSEVEKWAWKKLKDGGSPSRNIPIGAFLRRYGSECPGAAMPTGNARLSALRADTYPPAKIKSLAQDPGIRAGMLKRWESMEPYLTGC